MTIAPRDQGTHEQQPRAGRSAALRVRALLPRCESDIAATPDRVAAGAGWVPPSREACPGAGLDETHELRSSRHPETSEGRARPTWVLAVHLGAMAPRSRVAGRRQAACASVRGSDSRGPHPTPPGEAEPRAATPQLEQRETHRQRPSRAMGASPADRVLGPSLHQVRGQGFTRAIHARARAAVRLRRPPSHCTCRRRCTACLVTVTQQAQLLAADGRCLALAGEAPIATLA